MNIDIKDSKNYCIDIEDLKTTYKVLKSIMENEKLTKDTSFVRVRSIISNMICDRVTSEN